jgi:hypothetical protein
MFTTIVIAAAALLSLHGGSVDAQTLAQPTGDAQVAIEFDARVQGYMTLHRQAAEQEPGPQKNASIEEIDRRQRGLLLRLAAIRSGAAQGDVFTPPMEALVRRLLTRIFASPDGPQLRASIMDENPAGIRLRVNERYPDEVPMTTMPPDLLAALPRLPEGLEYRFVGEALVLIDVPAHLIVDFIPDALP